MARRAGRSPTIKMVAAAAGVSSSTVSRVFSQPHRLKASTVAHVKAVAANLGYVPDYTAQALSTGQLKTLAIVVPDIANPFFPPVIRAAQARADAAGFSTLLGDTDEDPAKELDLLAKLELRTDGVVLVSSRLPEEVIAERRKRHPLVLVNRDIADVPRVLVDSAPGVRAAVDHLVDLGHRHIAYVGGPASSWSEQQRRQAFLEQSELRVVVTTTLGAHRPDHEVGRSAVGEILASGATAAIAFDDVLAEGVLSGLAERGLVVPRDYSVIGCDDILAVNTYPPLTTLHGQSAEAGRLAVDILLAQIENGGGEDVHQDVRHTLVSTLVIRATTGPPPRLR